MKARFCFYLSLIIGLGVYCAPAISACTSTDATTCSSTLTNSPLPVVSSVAPNIVFMVDASGSMFSIVPDTPYNDGVTYTDCNAAPGGVQFGGDFASPTDVYTVNTIYSLSVKKSTGAVYITNTWGEPSDPPAAGSNDTFGITAGNKCFKQDRYYRATVNAYNNGTNFYYGNQWPGAIYKGNYLNWYFCTGTAPNCNGAANFGANAQRKSGTSSRMELAQSAVTGIINGLDNVRVGLFTYTLWPDQAGRLVREVGNLSTIRSTLLADIAALSSSTYMPTNGTPLAGTLATIGRYFALGGTGDLTLYPSGTPYTTGTQSSQTVAAVFPGTVGWSGTPATPIQYSCQKNFAVLMTDGMATNDRSSGGAPVSSYLREYARYCVSNPSNCRDVSGTYGYGMRKTRESGTNPDGSTWENYETDATSGPPLWTPNAQPQYDPSDYLDDVAAALYDIDLRPDLSGKQNVTTYTIGLADLALDYTTLLSRTALKGGGLFKTASNSAALVSAFQAATDDILAKDGAGAAVAVANAHVTNTDNASYATSYNSGAWSGDLVAYPINTNTGVPDINNPIWNTGCTNPTAYVDPLDTSKGVLGCSAQVLLDTKTPSTRYIFTSNDTAACYHNCGVPFLPTTTAGTAGTDMISAAQKGRLNTPSTTDGDDVVSYLRGVKTLETTPPSYRTRSHILGDTVDAEPSVIREPDHNYSDVGYSSYKSTNENRTRVVLQASNDGMVHAFNALTGGEEWAYIPDLLISSTKNNDPASSTTGILNTRTRKASFNHYFMIDATPVAGDVDFDKAGSAAGSGSPNWGTIVVGGLGKGGRGYYALNLTSTTATAEGPASTATSAAAKALWEFPRSIVDATARNSAANNLGYTFGKPIITKTAAAGWVVLVTSGYNNGLDTSQSTLSGATATTDSSGDGYGHLYVINPKTGDLIKDIVTPQCNTDVAASAANSQLYPCGLTHINSYSEERDFDNTTTYVYGGDLYGNVWRFDLTGGTTTSWSVVKLAVLRSSTAGTPVQPVTSTPELAKVSVSGSDYYYVYVGTGQYLDKIDLPCPPSPATCAWTPSAHVSQQQSMYGLIDPRPGSPTSPILADPVRGNLLTQTVTASGSTKTATATAMTYTGGAAKKGWVLDYTAGERIVNDPALAAGALVYTTNIPDTTACQPGGSSWIYAVDYANGGQITGATWQGMKLADALASRPVLIQLPNGTIKAITRLSDAKTLTTDVPVPATANAGKRVSWREILDQ